MMMKIRTRSLVCVAVAMAVLVPARAAAQSAAMGTLSVTVVDPTGAVLPAAVVTMLGTEAQTQAKVVSPATATAAGLAVVEGLTPGRYTMTVEFPGFATVTLRDVRVRTGDNRRTVTLPLKGFDEKITVGRDGQTAGLDPRGNAFSTVLTREMIEALPDDPDEMEAVLKGMSPTGAQIRIDGFSGGRLPPKSQIRSIRLPRMDQFAAQNHGGMQGMSFIDIMTAPGSGPLRGSVDTTFNDSAMNAKNPFAPSKGAEQLRRYGLSLSGTIRPNRTSFSINGGGTSQYSSPNLLAVLADGTTVTDNLRTPTDQFNASARLDHAVNKDHSLRLSVDNSRRSSRNQGVGGFDLLDRAFTSKSSTTTIRLSENGPLGRRMFSESRIQFVVGTQSSTSAIEAPTVRVLDAFTIGGAQRRGGQRRVEFDGSTDLDYVRGAHSWRTGVAVEGGRYRSDDMTNYLGTYTFASLDDYRAGRPMSYSRRIGDANLTYSRWQAAGYVQDDWRAARSLMVSAGLRFGVHSLTDDQFNLSPRLNLSWSPLRSGKVTVRGGYGYFYDWLSGDLYKQTLQIDGFRQRELNVRNPSFPDMPVEGTSTVTNQYLWSDDLSLPGGHRFSAGADRQLTANQRLSLSYTRGWGKGQLRGRNLNTPVNGVRPNPAFANILELVSDAETRSQSLNIGWNLTKLDWKQSFIFVNYTLGRQEANTTGAFALPANGDNLATEWGPSMGDVRHRATAQLSMRPIRSLSVSLNARVQSASPYNITTGRDDNGDGLFNDRPAGVSRNSGRGSGHVDVGGRVSYAWTFGAERSGGPQTGALGGLSGMAEAFMGGGAGTGRYRLEIFLSGQNVLNRANYVGHSGVSTSPFFGQPTNITSPRSVQVGARFGF
jgi:hypothetical protein